SSAAKSTYLIQMKRHKMPEKYSTAAEWYSDHFLSHTKPSSSSSSEKFDGLLYTYSSAFHGYAAVLAPEEVDAVRGSDAVAGVMEDRVYRVQTTRSPEFLGLDGVDGFLGGYNLTEINVSTSNVIVGVIDTGIWPEDPSFGDGGLPPVPKGWRGGCDSGIVCNNKLIGARALYAGYNQANGETGAQSPRDTDGHGSHTAGTAAGSPVANAGLFGYATGTARGIASQARLSIYKACYPQGCYASDIAAAMDRAISDGVHIISISLAAGNVPYNNDVIAIGAFAATANGILVSAAAGNGGPAPGSVLNLAPWILTVGAGTIDRTFPAYAKLGNGNVYTGISVYNGTGMGKNLVPLVYNAGGGDSSLCLAGSLNSSAVSGKVVVCDRGVNERVDKALAVMDAGGVGMILANTAAQGEDIEADPDLIPGMDLGYAEATAVRAYATAGRSPTAGLSFGGTSVNVKPAPVVAAFSARGPNALTPQILKPDLIGPGVNILAAWSQAVSPTGLPEDSRVTPFNILSGTSMSCPHISGVSAILKAIHPDWSPSAIKSALITTSYTIDNTNSPIEDSVDSSVATPFVLGAGHVDPAKAVSPGLVYDANVTDYVSFLCWSNYTAESISTIAGGRNVTCPEANGVDDPGQLNYPSFSVVFVSGGRPVSYTRVVTNVGNGPSTYVVSVTAPSAATIVVIPKELVFGAKGQKLQYTSTFGSNRGANATAGNAFGAISWISNTTQVTSPVAFTW
ncbi:hypothetical protein M569_13143, partial [Genlisea aurea]